MLQVVERVNTKVSLEEWNPKAPNIKFLVVFLAVQQLRRHVESSAYKLISCSSSLKRAEVSDFVSFINANYIFRFDIAMDKLFDMDSI